MKKGTIKSEHQKKTFRRILKMIAPYRIYVILSILSAAFSVIGQLYIPILSGRAIDYMIGIGKVDFAGIKDIIAEILVAAGIAGLAQWIMGTCNNRISFNVSRVMRDAALKKIQNLPLSYLDSHLTGDLVSRIIGDVDLFSDGLLMGFTQFFTGILTIIGTLVFMVTVNWPIALVVICVTPLSFLVAAFIAKKTFIYFNTQNSKRGNLTALVNERIEGLNVVQSFGYEEHDVEEFDKINDELCGVSQKAVFYSSITNPATRFVNNIVYAGVALSGALFAINGGITVGQLSCFLTYANQYTKPFNEISGVITEMQNAISCASRIFELLDAEDQKPESKSAEAITSKDISGKIDISHVDFSYSKNKELIKDFNLSVAPGERVALVGPTGCGKTTFINLLMRFYDVNSGSISVSGRDIRYLTRKSLRKSYGMVLQDTWLKSGTVFDNISYGKPDATREEVIQAAKYAYADGFIRRMPNGYDTVIGEDGGGLSQGQKQLLCIARVMLALPPMLILDEATSSIDTRTEILIQDAFSRMMKGRTSFIVAHRLSTIREADIILVMNNGRIVESGTHDSLLVKNGFYAKLYYSQFEGISI